MNERPKLPLPKLRGKDVWRSRRQNTPKNIRESVVPVVSASGMELGLKLVFSAALGAGVGVVLDKWLGLSPWFMVVGLLWGATVGFIGVIRSQDGAGRGDKESNTNESDRPT